MDEKLLFNHLAKQSKNVLLDHLRAAFYQMTPKQRRALFADVVPESSAAPKAGKLRKEIEEFHRASLAGNYYAPFMWDSKTYSNIRDETEEWCELCAKYLKKTSLLTTQEKHAEAVACFKMLWELMEAVDSGEEIIFAHEAGTWMIPVRPAEWFKAYSVSLAAVSNPQEYAAGVLPMLRRYKSSGYAAEIISIAQKPANAAQKKELATEMKQCNIQVRRTT